MQKFCHFASKNIYKWPKSSFLLDSCYQPPLILLRFTVCQPEYPSAAAVLRLSICNGGRTLKQIRKQRRRYCQKYIGEYDHQCQHRDG